MIVWRRYQQWNSTFHDPVLPDLLLIVIGAIQALCILAFPAPASAALCMSFSVQELWRFGLVARSDGFGWDYGMDSDWGKGA